MNNLIIDLSNSNDVIMDKSIGYNKLSIDVLHPGQTVESANYDSSTGTGWKINGDGTSSFGGSFYTAMKTRTTGDGTGDVTISCGFEAKMIKVKAVADVSGGWGGWSDGSTTSTGGQCIGYAHSSGGNWEKTYSTSNIIFVWDDGESNNSKASITSIGSSSFVLNFNAVNVDVRYIIEAYA